MNSIKAAGGVFACQLSGSAPYGRKGISQMWFEVAMVMTIFAFGNIFFGHFEERTPKWRRALKVAVFVGLTLAISAAFGRAWAMAFLIGAAVVPFVVIHLWWLPKHGINGWTGEPKEKYYRLRGWQP